MPHETNNTMFEEKKRSLGVDVSEKRGLDLVLMEETRKLLALQQRASLADLERFLEKNRPDAVAIDAPSCWGRSGGSRDAERELRRLGIHSYGTPSDPRKRERRFFGWMRRGMEAFDVCARAGYFRYVGGDTNRTAMEVFPHATAVILADGLTPEAIGKRVWRRKLLAAQGVPIASLSTIDLIDAALAALTGLYALFGEHCVVGDPIDGVIVLPCRRLPAKPFRRLKEPKLESVQPHLPHLRPCACGETDCHELTDAEFSPGHAAKRKALLWRRARAGRDAVEELKRRRWDLPPELK
jgi:predicted nuclease with RNAse H fold